MVTAHVADLAAVDELEETLLVCDVAHGVVLVWRFDGEFVGYMRAGGRGRGVACEAIGEGEETCAVRGLTIDSRTGATHNIIMCVCVWGGGGPLVCMCYVMYHDTQSPHRWPFSYHIQNIYE